MKLTASIRAKGLPVGVALLLSLFALWRLPYVIDPVPDNQGFARSIFEIFFLMASWRILTKTFTPTAISSQKPSFGLGFLFSLFLIVGRQLDRHGTFLPFGFRALLGMLFTLSLYTILFGAAISLLIQKTLDLSARLQEQRMNLSKKKFFIDLTGNGWFVFTLLLLAWLPIWLTFWPGTFRYDAAWQWGEYVGQFWHTHHPLLHTFLHGSLLKAGLKLTGSMTAAVAIYSAMQMAIVAGIFAYSCSWLYRRNVPFVARACVIAVYALVPLYPLWAFSATKDVLFSGFVLLLVLQIMDWWQNDYAALKSPKKIACFVITGLITMLLRHNGIHALLFVAPFLIAAAKNQRIRVTLVFICTLGIYLICNWGIIQLVQPRLGSPIEMLSAPLQQLCRVLLTSPDTISEEDQKSIQKLYFEKNIADIYDPRSADPIKWNADISVIEKEPVHYLRLWLRLGAQHPVIYLESFLAQNTAYFDPNSALRERIIVGCDELELYPIDTASISPHLRDAYERYARVLFLKQLPGSFLLSNSAFMVWLCILCLKIQLLRKQYGVVIAGVLLLALWLTNLLGPLSSMRYMLFFFYSVPILIARIFGEQESIIVKEHHQTE